jgi:glycosyltransferase involved in cell wall biosynthesis
MREGKVGASGTDTSAILVAEYLAKVGHEVVFAAERTTVGEKVRGVLYTNINFENVENKNFDVLVTSLWFSAIDTLPIIVTQSLIYWCHLAWMYSMKELTEYARKHNLKLGVVHISEWERKHNKSTVDGMEVDLKQPIYTTIIPNSITTDIIEDIEKLQLERKPHRAVFHAQWSRGASTALEAIKELGWSEDDFVTFDYLQSASKQRADKTILYRELAQSDYFIFPSFTSGRLVYKDTFSCAVAEALAMGVIVVAYPLGALPEYYNEYCTWADYPPGVNVEKLNSERLTEEPLMGNVSTIVEKVKYLENNPTFKQQLREAGKKYIKETFNIEKIGPRWEDYLVNTLQIKDIAATMPIGSIDAVFTNGTIVPK